jgi:hypothetical protein
MDRLVAYRKDGRTYAWTSFGSALLAAGFFIAFVSLLQAEEHKMSTIFAFLSAGFLTASLAWLQITIQVTAASRGSRALRSDRLTQMRALENMAQGLSAAAAKAARGAIDSSFGSIRRHLHDVDGNVAGLTTETTEMHKKVDSFVEATDGYGKLVDRQLRGFEGKVDTFVEDTKKRRQIVDRDLKELHGRLDTIQTSVADVQSKLASHLGDDGADGPQLRSQPGSGPPS